MRRLYLPTVRPDAMPHASPFVLALPGGGALDCTPAALVRVGAHVMGILNVTPDSFSDGGRHATVEAAVRRAGEMLGEGAAVIDIGGESTRPRGSAYGAGAAVVDADEEIRRVVPVVEAIVRQFPGAVVSIDTYKPAVARAALGAGAQIVNDVTGLRLFPAMAAVCAAAGAPLVVMHAVGAPGEMPHVAPMRDPVAEVTASLAASVAAAVAAGVAHVVVDAGFGFGKTPHDNLALVGATDEIRAALRRPVLVGVSRKATLGVVVGTPDAPAPVDARLYAGLGVALAAVARGAAIVRTHDVRATVEALRGWEAVRGSWGGGGV